MPIHKIYIEAPEEMTGQDVVIAIQEAFSWADEDWRNCVDANRGYPQEQAPYQAKVDRLRALTMLEDEPDIHQGIDPWGSEPDFPLEDWQYEVSNHDTHLGYTAWVLNQREQQKLDKEDPHDTEGTR